VLLAVLVVERPGRIGHDAGGECTSVAIALLGLWADLVLPWDPERGLGGRKVLDQFGKDRDALNVTAIAPNAAIVFSERICCKKRCTFRTLVFTQSNRNCPLSPTR
jgi:hypothetical protein